MAVPHTLCAVLQFPPNLSLPARVGMNSFTLLCTRTLSSFLKQLVVGCLSDVCGLQLCGVMNLSHVCVLSHSPPLTLAVPDMLVVCFFRLWVQVLLDAQTHLSSVGILSILKTDAREPGVGAACL